MDLLTLAMIKNKQGGGSSSGGSVNNNAYIIETSISTDVNTGDSVITLDKTFLEIKNQYMLGRQILLKVDPNGDGNHVAYFLVQV